MTSVKWHWEDIYQTKESNEVSWYQENPKTSLNLITEIGLNKDAKIIDIGAGDSKLVDNLIDIGFRNITLLDISTTALKIDFVVYALQNKYFRGKWKS